MTNIRHLLTEAFVVGVSLALALAGATALTKINSYSTALAVGFVLGAALHLLFELSGLNTMYCKSGHACLAESGRA